MGKHKRKSPNVIQTHHLVYQKGAAEEKTGDTVKLWKGEHWAITQMQRRKKISKGFLKALKYWIAQVEEIAKDI